jgi:hypothetical protein
MPCEALPVLVSLRLRKAAAAVRVEIETLKSDRSQAKSHRIATFVHMVVPVYIICVWSCS